MKGWNRELKPFYLLLIHIEKFTNSYPHQGGFGKTFIYVYTAYKYTSGNRTVNEKLKREMEKRKHIKWSEVIRSTVEAKIKEGSSRNLAEAVLRNERLRKKAPEGWDSTREIKRWRQRNAGQSYGPYKSDAR